MNVLSLFDGISCGRLALDRIGIPITNYYASEIDTQAKQVAQANYPDTIQIGDVCEVQSKDLPPIDLMLGGFPCQSFSVAGKGGGFDDPRGQLFFQLLRLKNELKPTWFLFENVRMKKELMNFISEQLECHPHIINSDRFVPQNRVRCYWTNIPLNQLPVKPEYSGNFYQIRRTYLRENKSGMCPTLTANMGTGGHNVPLINPEVNQGQLVLNDILETDVDQKYFLSEKQQAKYVRTSGNETGRIGNVGKYQGDRVVGTQGNAFTLSACGGNTAGGSGNIIAEADNQRLRRLTPTEAERLQTLPDGWTQGVSDSSRYKMIGNCWTVDVIAHILYGIVDQSNVLMEF